MAEHSSEKDGILSVINPREIDFGGFIVRRLLPSKDCHAVGPWVFFDHFGPTTFPAGQGVDVIPHPHINLSTVTYLFEGEIIHRDTLGSVQPIRPGAINFMCAGRGIAHSERTDSSVRAGGHSVHGVQLWCAMPEDHEERESTFSHYSPDKLPTAIMEGVNVRVMMGDAFGLSSPVETFSPTLYAEADLSAGAILSVAAVFGELAIYPVSGQIYVGNTMISEHQLAVLEPGRDVQVRADDAGRIVIIGGEPLGKRYMWWNFVSSRSSRIDKAKDDWRHQRYGKIPGESEYATLPKRDSFIDDEK